MKIFQKVLLHLLTAELCAGDVGVDICPDPAMLKSMASLISVEAAMDPMFSHVPLVLVRTRGDGALGTNPQISVQDSSLTLILQRQACTRGRAQV